MTTSRDPKRRDDDGRRAELIEAASRVIAREGVAAASSRKIAQEANLPPGLVHYWFAGMDELLEEVLSNALTSISAGADRGAGSERLLDRLQGAFRAVQQDDRGRQLALYEMTAWALRKPKLEHVAHRQYSEYHRVATDQISAWADDTGVRLPVDAGIAGVLLSALFDGLVLSWLADPEGTDVDAVLTLASTLIEQLAASPAKSP